MLHVAAVQRALPRTRDYAVAPPHPTFNVLALWPGSYSATLRTTQVDAAVPCHTRRHAAPDAAAAVPDTKRGKFELEAALIRAGFIEGVP